MFPADVRGVGEARDVRVGLAVGDGRLEVEAELLDLGDRQLAPAAVLHDVLPVEAGLAHALVVVVVEDPVLALRQRSGVVVPVAVLERPRAVADLVAEEPVDQIGRVGVEAVLDIHDHDAPRGHLPEGVARLGAAAESEDVERLAVRIHEPVDVDGRDPLDLRIERLPGLAALGDDVEELAELARLRIDDDVTRRARGRRLEIGEDRIVGHGRRMEACGSKMLFEAFSWRKRSSWLTSRWTLGEEKSNEGEPSRAHQRMGTSSRARASPKGTS